MSRLERYLCREFVPVFVLATLLYVALFLLQALLVRIPWLDTLPFSALGPWLVYQIPSILPKAFPLAIILAVLLVLGRIARDHELLAMQLGGQSLAQLLRPLVVLALLLVGLGLWMAEYIIPVANERTKLAWWDSVDGGGIALAFLSGQQIVVGDYTLHFSNYHKPSRALREVRLEAWTGPGRKRQLVCFASSATFETIRRSETSKAMLNLQGYACRTFDHSQLPLSSDESIRDFFVLEHIAKSEESTLSITLPLSKEQLIARNLEGGFDNPRPLSEFWREWRSGQEPSNRTPALELATRTAWPFASLVFLFLTAPLASSSTRSTGSSLGLALLISVAYQLIMATGQMLAHKGLIDPFLGPWLANLAFIVFGFWLLLRFR
ncbi:MAG: LptF/LptG family permease [Meiothermus sp.]|nr:LptF/LptG family permease [Meiothermus sp.]